MFEYAVQKARELADDYKLYALNGAGSRKCEKQFLWRCQDALQLKIDVHYLPVALPRNAMNGTYIRRPDGFDILLKPNLPPAWERYVFVKEVFHAILDGEPFHNPNVMEHLDKTLFGEIPSTSGTMPLHVISEYATQAAAAEFLFPWADRKSIIDSGIPVATSQIAAKYDIPDTIAEHYLTPSAMKFYEFP